MTRINDSDTPLNPVCTLENSLSQIVEKVGMSTKDILRYEQRHEELGLSISILGISFMVQAV